VTSSQPLPEGHATIRVVFLSEGGAGKSGTVELYVNDKKVAGRVEKTVPGRFSAGETFDIGMDTGLPVPGTRGEIEKLEREARFRKAMSD
jgi:arylsulfatase